MSETVTIDGTEVEVAATEDGFEAEAVASGDSPAPLGSEGGGASEVPEEPDDGLYLRGESASGAFGFEIPLDAEKNIISNDESGHFVAWHRDDNIDEDFDQGGNRKAAKESLVPFDGYTFVRDIELVRH